MFFEILLQGGDVYYFGRDFLNVFLKISIMEISNFHDVGPKLWEWTG